MSSLNRTMATANSRTSLVNTGFQAGRLVWLAYLVIYPAPWLFKAPSGRDLAAAAVGVGVFLIIYLSSLRTGRSLPPRIVAISLIGFALSPFHGIWAVFNVYASSMAGRLGRRRNVVTVMVLLQATFVIFGLLSG